MLKKIRKSVFETNSSSMHSVCVSSEDKYADYSSGVMYAQFDDFGWGLDELKTPIRKLSYVITSIQYQDTASNIQNAEDVKENIYFTWLQEMIRDYNGCVLELLTDSDDETDIGYVDHQSSDILDEYWSSDESTFKSNMKELIFNSKYTIIIDHDNH